MTLERRTQHQEHRQRLRGERAEQVASWYFRLNGFFSIPGFVIHPDQQSRYPRTEADLVAVRFPFSEELIGEKKMDDDALLTNLTTPCQTLFLMVEVKCRLCKINGPWSDSSAKNMQRVIRRMGFAEPGQIDAIAKDMYSLLRWEGQSAVLQYISVGESINNQLQRKYPRLKQIVWDQIADFLFGRFQGFPPKLPPDGRNVHNQWPDFGRAFGQQFPTMSNQQHAREYVRSYIEKGPAAMGRTA